jgi:hypothetical protein
MALSKILTRSPYFIEVTGALNDVITVELFIYNDPSSAPTTVTKTLSKTIFTGTSVSFNVSPYLREYIDVQPTCVVDALYPKMNQSAYCRLKYKTYINGTLNTTVTSKYCFDGYGYFEDGYNPNNSDFFLDEGTYYYYSGSTGLNGTLSLGVGANWSVKYSEIGTSNTTTVSLGASAGVCTIDRVNYATLGNKLEILNASNVVQATYYFLPKDECKYAPVAIDFINRFGVPQREIMWKASYKNFEVSSTPFKAMPSGVNYDTSKAINQIMNVNGKESIKVNTDWVDENYAYTLQEIMLSEKVSADIYFNGELQPVKLRTTSIEMHKHINQKLINYTLEFEFAYDKLNNVI